MRKLLSGLLLSSASFMSFASDLIPFEMNYSPNPKDYVVQEGRYPYEQCFIEAAEQYKNYGVEVNYLKAIAWQESRFQSNAFNDKNATPTEDIGVMQINSWWLESHLKPYNITKEKLYEPCLNIHVGAWVLANELKNRDSLWEAIGYYNAKTKWKRERYISHVKKAYQGILSGGVLSAYWGKAKSPTQVAYNPVQSSPRAYTNQDGLLQPSWEDVRGLLKNPENPKAQNRFAFLNHYF